MGYTHYFSQSRDFTTKEWEHLCKAVGKIIENCNVEIKYECDSDDPPQIDDECIRFNGKDGDGHETFLITKTMKPRGMLGTFRFCKTARKPYDEIVTLVLLHIHLVFPDTHDISSDGSWDDEWKITVSRHCEIFPEINCKKIRCPWIGYYDRVTVSVKGRFGQKE